MSKKIQISSCPVCGSDNIQRNVQDLIREYEGQTYTVPTLEYYECPDCHEKIFDSEAMQKIQAHSPAYHKQKV